MDIQQEIESMTAVATVSNAAGLGVHPMTMTGRIARWLRLRRLPKNQRLLHYGFPVVSGKQLADRLGVTAFNVMTSYEDQVIKACLAKKGHALEDCKITEVKVYRNIGGGSCTWTRNGKIFLEMMDRNWPRDEKKAAVKFDPVNSYCREVIPDRCLGHINIAKSNGLSLKK